MKRRIAPKGEIADTPTECRTSPARSGRYSARGVTPRIPAMISSNPFSDSPSPGPVSNGLPKCPVLGYRYTLRQRFGVGRVAWLERSHSNVPSFVSCRAIRKFQLALMSIFRVDISGLDGSEKWSAIGRALLIGGVAPNSR